jgi:hypothetical protein
LIAHQQEEIVTHFCLAAQYTPQALNNIMDNPTTSRYEAAKGLIESVGGTLISIARVAIHPDGCILMHRRMRNVSKRSVPFTSRRI